MKRIACGVLVAGGLLVAPSLHRTAMAEDVKFELKASEGMRDILVEHTGKRVTLYLTNGAEIEGTIKTVGLSLVHVSRLVGREFYDAVVSLDKIAALRMRMREK